ncbi:SRPBCC family protein [Dyadobacter sandarakinus]|uniref:SRPBCC domain-containing protein n=1 Tax=Dyadobacter sandarakinus TaxID=2747268 RepID=A0ABX7I2X7_9BACT|nr:SRPBCC domain-containing protein [Dyadobacter sandarakinus]QRR00414.1 SRPBCC domain-containing protein [Dyadobacter sandarakinus]
MESKTAVICPPDLTLRPLSLKVEKLLALPVIKVFRAWTTEFDLWFAAPGSLLGKPEPNCPFYFETFYGGIRHPHYGRFLSIEEPHRVEMTWITGASGTRGAETLLTIELVPHEVGTFIKLTHAGFADTASRDLHNEAWPLILGQLHERMSRPAD